MNRVAYFALILVVVLAAGIAGFQLSAKRTGASPSGVNASALSALMSLRLDDLGGKSQALSQWRGQVLVINFWATWCPPCRREIPGFARISTKLAANGVQFVGISTDSAEKVRDFVRAFPFPYPNLLGDESLLQLTQNLGNPTQALPFTIILDPAGRVVFVREGFLPEDELWQALKTVGYGARS